MSLSDESAVVAAVAGSFAAFAALVALVYSARSANAARRAIQLQVFDGIFRDIKRLDAQYRTEFKSRNTAPTAAWCDDFFNTLEYLAFLLNHKMILRDEMHDFFKDAVPHWYRTFSETVGKKDLDNPDCFPEFKKLHRILKNDGLG